jgi:hypothetical protein
MAGLRQHRAANGACPARTRYVLIPFVFPLAPPAPADTFARLIAGLCRAIAARSPANPLAWPLMLLAWSRLRRMATRFARLALRLRAGNLSPRRPVRSRAGARRPATPRPRLPEGFGWLVRLVPEAAAGASQLQHLLGEPEMAALIAAAPQAGRILRPLCRLLGVRPPPALLTAPAAPVAAPPLPAAASPGLTGRQAPSAVSPPAPWPPPARAPRKRTSWGRLATHLPPFPT